MKFYSYGIVVVLVLGILASPVLMVLTGPYRSALMAAAGMIFVLAGVIILWLQYNKARSKLTPKKAGRR